MKPILPARRIVAETLELLLAGLTAALNLGGDLLSLYLMEGAQQDWSGSGILPSASLGGLLVLTGLSRFFWVGYFYYWRPRASVPRLVGQVLTALSLLPGSALWGWALLTAVRLYERAFFIVLPGAFLLLEIGALLGVALRLKDLLQWRFSTQNRQN